MKRHRRSRTLLGALAVLVTTALQIGLSENKAHAIIGRPLTPMSYAGVARRTTRRAAGRGSLRRTGLRRPRLRGSRVSPRLRRTAPRGRRRQAAGRLVAAYQPTQFLPTKVVRTNEHSSYQRT